LFPHLLANGFTPEGLTFEAIMDDLICKKAGESYYFLTISDGEPSYVYTTENNVPIVYNTTNGSDHTRKQYKKIVSVGVKGIAYFIKGDSKQHISVQNVDILEKCFRHMYGNDAKFIDVNNVISIAKTMNELFLEKD
jgi:hypothetical protein